MADTGTVYRQPGGIVTERSTGRVRRTRGDRVVAGVCGGVGEYLGVDPLLVRLAAVAVTVSGGVGVLAYLIAWVLLPEADRADAGAPPAVVGRRVSAAFGVFLVAFSVVLLFGPQSVWVDAAVVWPLAAVALVAVYAGTRR